MFLAACVTVTTGAAGLIVLGFAKVDAASPKPSAVVTCADARKPANTVPVPNRIDATCAVIPTDFNGIPEQNPADIYSWLSFIALNWPVNATTCVPAPGTSILTGPQNPTWLTYLTNDDVFVPAGQKPSGWCGAPAAGRAGAHATGMQANNAMRTAQLAHVPPAVKTLAMQYFSAHPAGRLLFLHHNAKGDDLVSTLQMLQTHRKGFVATGIDPAVLKEILDATNKPVVDQNGRFERFTISMNYDEYNYITSKQLWTAKGQKAAGNLKFPVAGDPGATVGSLEFKAGWKVLTPGKDIVSHFFTMPAIVYNDQAGTGPPQNVTVGLVALHITHKTPKQKFWLWSTFEHIDNTTDGPQDGNPKNFYNPNCSPASCPPNTQTATGPPYMEVKKDGTRNAPTQVVAVTYTPSPNVITLNTHFRTMLRNTPWQYYQLLSTQWIGENGPIPSPNPAKLGPVHPFSLSNPVMETYVPPGSLYSCVYCHSLMQRDRPGNFLSDFSLMINAKQ